MKIISIVSPKGGVGKTTISANISVGLTKLGYSVVALDLDSQNALQSHFFINKAITAGIVSASIEEKSWHDIMQSTPLGVDLLPHGKVTEETIQQFEDILRLQPLWILDNLQKMNLNRDTIVVIDTPPGSTHNLRQALRAADLVIGVTFADAGSYTALPQLQFFIDDYCKGRAGFIDYGLIINQVDQTKQLSKDINLVINSIFSDRIIGQIHKDEAVSESLAYGESIFEYSPYSEAAHEIMKCCYWIKNKINQSGG